MGNQKRSKKSHHRQQATLKEVVRRNAIRRQQETAKAPFAGLLRTGRKTIRTVDERTRC